MKDKMDPEIFLPIKGFEGLYEISNHGNVRSLERYVDACYLGTKFKRFIPERILKPGLNDSGYLIVILAKTKTKRTTKINRLVCIHFHENPNNYPFTMHLDNNPLNNYYENLKWGTAKMNSEHCSASGNVKIPVHFGLKNVNGKISDKQVVSIRELYNSGVSCKEISKNYPVTSDTIRLIAQRKTHVNIP